MVESKGNDTASRGRRTNLNKQLKNTRMCMYFEQGVCKYGAKCQFAHSLTALESAPDLKKTRICPQFEAGGCDDPNCPFAHGHEELRSTDFYFRTSMCMWHAAGKCRNGDRCRFAHGEHELRQVEGQSSKPMKAKVKAPTSGDVDQSHQKGKDRNGKRGEKEVQKDAAEGKAQQYQKNGKRSEKDAQKVATPLAQPKTAPAPKLAKPMSIAAEPMFIEPIQDFGPLAAGGYPTMQAQLAPPSRLQVEASPFLSLSPMVSPAGAPMWQSAAAAPGGGGGKPQQAKEIESLSANIKYLSDQVKKLQLSITPSGMKSESTKSGGSHLASSDSSGGSSPPGSPSPPSQQKQLPPIHPLHMQQQHLHAEVARLNWELQRAAISQGLLFGHYDNGNQVPVR